MQNLKGVIKYVNAAKGYGFITPDDKDMPDLFFSLDQLRGNAARLPQKGENVIYEQGEGKRGPIAMKIYNMADMVACDEYLADLEVERRFNERRREAMKAQILFKEALIEKNRQWRAARAPSPDKNF